MVDQPCRQTDPYYPFEQAVDVWARTFAALGINYKVGLDPYISVTLISAHLRAAGNGWRGLNQQDDGGRRGQ